MSKQKLSIGDRLRRFRPTKEEQTRPGAGVVNDYDSGSMRATHPGLTTMKVSPVDAEQADRAAREQQAAQASDPGEGVEVISPERAQELYFMGELRPPVPQPQPAVLPDDFEPMDIPAWMYTYQPPFVPPEQRHDEEPDPTGDQGRREQREHQERIRLERALGSTDNEFGMGG